MQVIGYASLFRKCIRTSYCRFRFFSKLASQSVPAKKSNFDKWEPVIGLEIHAQIYSESKLFSGAGTQYAAPINTQVSLLDAALPGTLPRINRRCVEAGVKTALALNCSVNMISRFDRKHYFYADLPAGYQITQQRQPLAVGGVVPYIVFNPAKGVKKPVQKSARLIQLQLEQDSGKSLHDPDEHISLIDLNRAGVGLMEIVTEPDFHSSVEVSAFVREVQLILQCLNTCDGKMAEGSFRIDASVSLHRPGEPLGTRTEVKNLNSVRFVSRAIDYEIERQMSVLESGGEVKNETRSYDVDTGRTVLMRDKERLHDYRFMPEPNLPPLYIHNNETYIGDTPHSQIINIDTLKGCLPPLPQSVRTRLQDEHGLSVAHSIIVVQEPGMCEMFETLMMKRERIPQSVVNFLTIEVLGHLNSIDKTLEEGVMTVSQLGELVDFLQENIISNSAAAQVLEEIGKLGGDAIVRDIVEKLDLFLITDPAALEPVCQEVLDINLKAINQYKKGKKKILNFFIGQVQQQFNGHAHGKLVKEIILKKLSE